MMPTYTYNRALVRSLAVALLFYLIAGMLLLAMLILHDALAASALNGHSPRALLLLHGPVVAFILLLALGYWLGGRRLLSMTYALGPTNISRHRGTPQPAIEYSSVTDVTMDAMRGLTLKTRGRALSLSLKVDGAGEMIEHLKDAITNAGGTFPERTYNKAVVSAAFSKWLYDNLWSIYLGGLYLAMPLALAGYLIAATLDAHDEDRLLGSIAALCILIAFLIVSWCTANHLFRNAWKAGRRDMGRELARKVSLVSALLTLAISAIAGAAIWCVIS